jgi:hypothetical protein
MMRVSLVPPPRFDGTLPDSRTLQPSIVLARLYPAVSDAPIALNAPSAADALPNGHALSYSNVIVAHWPRPDTGQLVRAWYCKTCKATIYDD